MVYIRSKVVKGESYSYLVKSNWIKKRKTSEQETIKYLGRTANVTLNDIPPEYRDSKAVLSYLASNDELDIEKREEYLANTRQNLLKFLLEGNFEDVRLLCRNFLTFSKIGYFFDEVLRPVMYEIGSLWKSKQLDVGAEHIATNTAMRLIEGLAITSKMKSRGKTILICTPNGEHHLLPCIMIETFLSQNGYKIINLSPSAPTKSILSQIIESKPDLVLISITLADNINSAKRLVGELKELKSPVLIGGQAVQEGKKFGHAQVMGSPTMLELMKIIKNKVLA